MNAEEKTEQGLRAEVAALQKRLEDVKHFAHVAIFEYNELLTETLAMGHLLLRESRAAPEMHDEWQRLGQQVQRHAGAATRRFMKLRQQMAAGFGTAATESSHVG